MTPNRNSKAGPGTRAAKVTAAAPGDDATRKRIGRQLLAWYAKHRRELPWRKRDDAYAIWVSEVMLQQTQVATAGPYYERWMRRFPTLTALAKAPEQEVLSAWAGLGYYSRARSLHAGAKLVCQDGGQLPKTAEKLRRLPGIGPYTAGAIASIAYGLDEPAVDGNVIRVLTRLFALPGAPQRHPLKDQLWALAAALIPAGRARDFNQALMELGALRCTPKRPLCDRCPVAAVCRAHAAGEETRYPELPPRPKTTIETHVAVAASRKGRVLVAQLPPSAPRWAGMWVFPMTKVAESEDTSTAATRALGEFAGVTADGLTEADSIVHSVTRYRITLRLFRGSARGRTRRASAELRWVNAHELAQLPMPAAQRKLALRLKLVAD